jgi:DNA-binding MarR family transcriptional regulator
MSGKLQKEIHKANPFDCLEQEAFLNTVRTADYLSRAFDDLLKPFNLSSTQYNVLRILRGHAESGERARIADVNGRGDNGGIPCKVIGEEMITRDPDITRLLDRLEARDLITRCRDSKDRRVVATRITPEGLKLLKELDKPVVDLHRRQFAHLTEAKLTHLIDLLEQARAGD